MISKIFLMKQAAPWPQVIHRIQNIVLSHKITTSGIVAVSLHIYPLSTTGQNAGKRIMVMPYDLQTFVIHCNQNEDQS